jgi:DNA-binding response OmpR family regulator
MAIDENRVKSALDKYRILIVEDDRELAENLFFLIKLVIFKQEPVVVHTMEAAVREVANEAVGFGLVILDVMLPETEEHLKKIEQFQMMLDELRNLIKSLKYKTDELSQSEIEAARDKRARCQRQIDDLVVQVGGIQLVEEWRKNKRDFPVLFLTAVGDKDIVERGRRIAGDDSDWITKPSTNELILEKCANLIENWERRKSSGS